jgi:3-hydroxyisobutyrate dehydrogenase-like beta-hydroxyacid dehydrogenase
MRWAETPRAVAQASDVIFSMVTDGAALHAITEGPDGLVAGLSPGKIYVDMSTVGPSVSRAVAAQVRALGASMLDAPVSGSPVSVDQGQLSIMVGGDREAFARVEPLLRDIGPRVTHLGGNGLALTMKIAINLSLPAQFLAFAEGVLLAEKSGIDRAVAVDVLLQSVVASPALRYRAPFVLDMPEHAWFTINLMQKDLLLAMDLGRAIEVPVPTAALVNEWLTAARARGLADQDFAALFDVLACMAGRADNGAR